MPTLKRTKKGWDIYGSDGGYKGTLTRSREDDVFILALRGTVRDIREITDSKILHTLT